MKARLVAAVLVGTLLCGMWGTAKAATPRAGTTPTIRTVHFSRIGPDLHIEVDGTGFGAAPQTLPIVANIDQFQFTDVTQGGWTAGRNNVSSIQLQYASWTDTRIVVDGFDSQYGGQNKVSPGDKVTLYVQNASGPEFAIWSGVLLPGVQPTPVQLISPAQNAEVKGGSVPFSWTPVKGAAAYYLQVYLAQAANGVAVRPGALLNIAWQGAATHYSLSTAHMLKGTYRWRVAAIDKAGELIVPLWTEEQVFTLS